MLEDKMYFSNRYKISGTNIYDLDNITDYDLESGFVYEIIQVKGKKLDELKEKSRKKKLEIKIREARESLDFHKGRVDAYKSKIDELNEDLDRVKERLLELSSGTCKNGKCNIPKKPTSVIFGPTRIKKSFSVSKRIKK